MSETLKPQSRAEQSETLEIAGQIVLNDARPKKRIRKRPKKSAKS